MTTRNVLFEQIKEQCYIRGRGFAYRKILWNNLNHYMIAYQVPSQASPDLRTIQHFIDVYLQLPGGQHICSMISSHSDSLRLPRRNPYVSYLGDVYPYSAIVLLFGQGNIYPNKNSVHSMSWRMMCLHET